MAVVRFAIDPLLAMRTGDVVRNRLVEIDIRAAPPRLYSSCCTILTSTD
jgi:hypothetical protein